MPDAALSTRGTGSHRIRAHREDEGASVPAGCAKVVEVPHGFTLSIMRAGNGTTARLLANEYGPLIKIVPTYWHVLRDGMTYNQGNIPLSLISKQMVVLNRVFKKANIQFKVGVFCGVFSPAFPLVPLRNVPAQWTPKHTFKRIPSRCCSACKPVPKVSHWRFKCGPASPVQLL